MVARHNWGLYLVALPARAGMTLPMLQTGGLTVTVCATVEKAKHSANGKFFIPWGTSSYAIFRRSARTEFRHDSCNTAPR